MNLLRWTLLVAALSAACAHAQPAASAPAESSASHGVPRSAGASLTPREALEVLSQIAYFALTRLETQRGARFSDDELSEALRSEAFQREYSNGLAVFCSDPARARNLACRPASVPQPLKGVTS